MLAGLVGCLAALGVGAVTSGEENSNECRVECGGIQGGLHCSAHLLDARLFLLLAVVLPLLEELEDEEPCLANKRAHKLL